jgi:Zn ribbon nucleic-acid-binding protein
MSSLKEKITCPYCGYLNAFSIWDKGNKNKKDCPVCGYKKIGKENNYKVFADHLNKLIYCDSSLIVWTMDEFTDINSIKELLENSNLLALIDEFDKYCIRINFN